MGDHAAVHGLLVVCRLCNPRKGDRNDAGVRGGEVRIAIYPTQPPGGARRALHGFGSVLARRHLIDVFTLSTADDMMLNDADYASSVTRLPFEPARPKRGRHVLNDIREANALDRLDDVNRAAARMIDGRGYDVV